MGAAPEKSGPHAELPADSLACPELPRARTASGLVLGVPALPMGTEMDDLVHKTHQFLWYVLVVQGMRGGTAEGVVIDRGIIGMAISESQLPDDERKKIADKVYRALCRTGAMTSTGNRRGSGTLLPPRAQKPEAVETDIA